MRKSLAALSIGILAVIASPGFSRAQVTASSNPDSRGEENRIIRQSQAGGYAVRGINRKEVEGHLRGRLSLPSKA
jgi:hypothetical protein